MAFPSGRCLVGDSSTCCVHCWPKAVYQLSKFASKGAGRSLLRRDAVMRLLDDGRHATPLNAGSSLAKAMRRRDNRVPLQRRMSTGEQLRHVNGCQIMRICGGYSRCTDFFAFCCR